MSILLPSRHNRIRGLWLWLWLWLWLQIDMHVGNWLQRRGAKLDIGHRCINFTAIRRASSNHYYCIDSTFSQQSRARIRSSVAKGTRIFEVGMEEGVGIRRWQAIRDVLGAELIASASGRYLHVSLIGLVAPIPTEGFAGFTTESAILQLARSSSEYLLRRCEKFVEST